jgi:hypothetical protein
MPPSNAVALTTDPALPQCATGAPSQTAIGRGPLTTRGRRREARIRPPCRSRLRAGWPAPGAGRPLDSEGPQPGDLAVSELGRAGSSRHSVPRPVARAGEDVEHELDEARAPAEDIRRDVERRVDGAREEFERPRERFGDASARYSPELERVFERPQTTSRGLLARLRRPLGRTTGSDGPSVFRRCWPTVPHGQGPCVLGLAARAAHLLALTGRASLLDSHRGGLGY